jgi:hypothetical protein
MFLAQCPYQPLAPVSDLHQAATTGFISIPRRLSTTPTQIPEALALDRRNDRCLWPDFLDQTVNAVVDRPDQPRCLTPEAGKEPVA